MFPWFSGNALDVKAKGRGPPVAQTQDQRRASRAVSAWLAHHERNTAWLVRQTEVDPGTIGDFLNGNRWPKFKTQGRIEKAIGWPAGTMTEIADGAEPPAVGGDGKDPETRVDLIFRRPEELTDEQWEQVMERTRGVVEWTIEQVVREG